MNPLKKIIFVLFLLVCVLVSAGCVSEEPAANEENSLLAEDVKRGSCRRTGRKPPGCPK
ncbi:hypothetical protein [Methanosarcina siciliae]|uniref:hypothetical protein n=1 Tax=Methanosarcina siciliae TaxID=38027 RepID=UPI000AB892DC|nr:hypothetical protein [Methanosarcina siciliae]